MNHEVPWLRRGKGDTPADGGCIMQIVDWISTGGWSDQPRCVAPHIQDIAIGLNDSLSDRGRQKLLRLAPRMMGTVNSTREVRRRWERAYRRAGLLGRLLLWFGRPGEWLATKLMWLLMLRYLRIYDRYGPGRMTTELDYSGVCEVLPAEHKRELAGVR